MNHRLPVVAVLLSIAVACAPADNAANTEADVEAIRAVIAQELAAVRNMDMDSFTAIWTDDVMIVPPNEPAVSGDAAFQWAQGFASAFSGGEAAYSDEEIVVAGDWAYHSYAMDMTLTPAGGGDPMVEQGRGIHIFRRGADGSWKLAHDVWNGNAPPPPGM
jgi:uncharacterized protein (TIGR02246 family)